MSKLPVKIAISPVAGSSENLPVCTPNLMPFHIDYNGPAAVTTFMRIEKLAETMQNGENNGNELLSNEVTAKHVLNLEETRSEISEMATGTPTTTVDPPVHAHPTLTRTTTESTLVSESSSATLTESTSVVSLSSSPSHSQVQSPYLAPPIEDLSNRYVSTFRGRSIHGLTVDLPTGYGGVVLTAKTNPEEKIERRVVRSAVNMEEIRNEEDTEMDAEVKVRRPRRRGRLTSSAAPRKGTVVTISDEDSPIRNSDVSTDSHVDIEMSDPIPELDSLRLLVPTSRFDSFTLWQADRMVNKTNDEYWRTLTEWIGLAHVIHATN